MKTKNLLIVTVCLISICFGLWYFFILRDESRKISRLIPRNSLGVVAINNLSNSIIEYEKYEWWDELSSLPFLQNLLEVNSKVDSLVNAGVLQTKVNTNPIYISFHITSNSEIQPLIFIGAQGFDWIPENIETLAQMWFDEEIKLSQRIFNDQTIYESNKTDIKWGFIITGGFLVISPNSVLLEDVIRTEEGENFRLFHDDEKTIIDTENITIVLNTERLNRLQSVFTGTLDNSPENYLDGLVTFNVITEAYGISFSGIGTSSSTALASIPTSSAIKAENFIPSSATSVLWYGLANKKADVSSLLDFDKLIAMQNSEVCEIRLDLGDKVISKVLLSEVKDVNATLDLLNKLSSDNRAEGDTLFMESFMNNEIRFVNREHFFETLYGKAFKGMNKPYYSFFNNMLFMSDKIDAIKVVLSDYEAENTWGRIPTKRRYVDNLIREANITQINNFEYALEPFINSLSPKWGQFFKENDRLFSTFDNFTYQLNSNANSVLMSAQLSFTDAIKINRRNEEMVIEDEILTLMTNVYADTILGTKPYVVKNHNNNSQELIFQDLSNQLYLVDRNGNVVWKKSLEGKINGDIQQIDFYNNKKLQYLLITDSIMHVIDRNGDEVENFPRPLKTELPILKYSVVDYDNSKNYRYATTDRRGNLYLLDKNGDQLEGWMPKTMGGPLLAAPEHIRIRGRDCFIIVQTNGDIHLTTRKGEAYPGFPLSLSKRLSGEYYINQGPSFTESNLQLVTEDGEVISIDFNGAIKNRSQLLKPSVQSKFLGVRDKLGTGLVIVRKDFDRVTFYDNKGSVKFEKDMPTNDELVFIYYNFRNDSELYAIQDLTNGDLLILDEKGDNKLSKQNFTKNEIGIFYYQNRREYELLVNFENQMAIYKFAK